MSKQDRLLSDEELLAELMFGKKTYTGYRSGEDFSVNGFLSRESAEKLLDIINTQKRLYAESVIGEDEDPVYASAGSITRKNIIEYQNRLRAEQRSKLLKALG